MAKITKKTTKSKTAKPKARTAAKKAASAVKKQYNAITNEIQTVTPYLAMNNALEGIAWYKKVFGAKTVGEVNMVPGNKVMHATLKIGDSQVFLSDIFPGSDMMDATRSGASVNLNLFHKDADKFWNNAVANGAKVTMPMDDMFWGDRYGRIIDPFGHSWAITRKSKLSAKELEAKRVESMKQFGA